MKTENVLLFILILMGIFLYKNFREGACSRNPELHNRLMWWNGNAQGWSPGAGTGNMWPRYGPACSLYGLTELPPAEEAAAPSSLINRSYLTNQVFMKTSSWQDAQPGFSTCEAATNEADCLNTVPWNGPGVKTQDDLAAWWNNGGAPPGQVGLHQSHVPATCATNMTTVSWRGKGACIWTSPPPCPDSCPNGSRTADKTCTDTTCSNCCTTPSKLPCPGSCPNGSRTADTICSDATCSNCCTTPLCPATCTGGQKRTTSKNCISATDCTNCCEPNSCPTTCSADNMLTKDKNCTDATCSNCCTAKPAQCSSFTCPSTKSVPKQYSQSITCKGNPCTAAECCDSKQLCSAIKCQGNTYNPDPTKVCSSAICTPSECCIQDPTCQGYECPQYYSPYDSPGEIICENGTCTTGTCCVENSNCSNFANCPAFTHPKADGKNIICADTNCTEEECCGENPYCSTYYCPQTFYKTGKLINNASSVQCSQFPCTDAECCTFSPSGRLPEIRIWPIYKGQV